MNDGDEIHIPLSLLIIPTMVILVLIGWFASPLDDRGRPLLLLPDIKAVEDYRRLALSWNEELHLVDGEIAKFLADETYDLYGQSRQAQRTTERVLKTVQAIDRKEAPPTLIGLREDLKLVSISYLESSRLVLRWLSMPDQANRNQVEQSLTKARSGLKELERNQWLVKRSP
jgi:hypothetical protein